MAWHGFIFCVALQDDTTSVRLKICSEQNTNAVEITTHRFGGGVKLVGSAEFSSMAEARILETRLKRKKNPAIAITELASLGKN
jgi:hypothetical protein